MSTVQLGMPTVRPQHASPVSTLRGERGFPEAAREALGDATLRANMRHATSTIQAKRAGAVREVRDWQKLAVTFSIMRRFLPATPNGRRCSTDRSRLLGVWTTSSTHSGSSRGVCRSILLSEMYPKEP